MSKAFFKKVSEGIDNEIQSEFINYQANKNRSEEDQKRLIELVNQSEKLQKSVIVRIIQLDRSDLTVDKSNLKEDMENSMVLHSKIIDDIYDCKSLVEKMKVLLNCVVGILHHNLKFKNQFSLKTAKDIDTYIAQEPTYNMINIRIKEIQNLIEKSSEFSYLVKQKIGFIRDLTKMRTQEMFHEA